MRCLRIWSDFSRKALTHNARHLLNRFFPKQTTVAANMNVKNNMDIHKQHVVNFYLDEQQVSKERSVLRIGAEPMAVHQSPWLCTQEGGSNLML